jgi:hypothetical protein
MEKERNRNLMLYDFKCGHSAASAPRNICRIEDAGTVKESTCRRWFAKFLNGEEGLKDVSFRGVNTYKHTLNNNKLLLH